VLYTTSCKHSLVLLRKGEIIARNTLSWLNLLIICYCFIWLFVYIIISVMHGVTNIQSVHVFCTRRLSVPFATPYIKLTEAICHYDGQSLAIVSGYQFFFKWRSNFHAKKSVKEALKALQSRQP
jgi:uncharacterized membrane protein